MKTPILSIIMPVFNAEKFIKKSIESILYQTFTDFELIVVDDACSDKSIEIVISFHDNRIKVIKNESNKGIVYSRNRGNAVACGKYIAPFDADDIALPDKFERQVSFMENHPEYGFLGSWAKLIDENGDFMNINWKLSARSELIPAIMLFRAYFIQSAVVFRREALVENSYTEGYAPSEDYKIYYDISNKFKTFNFPEYLTYYRIHQGSITQSKLELCLSSELKLYKYIYKPLEIEIDEKLYSLLQLIKNNTKINDAGILHEIENFLLLIIKQNKKFKLYDQKQLCRVVFNRWMKVCSKSKINLLKIFFIFSTSPLIVKFIRSK